jgi:shikimate dehydrogenase
MDARYHAVTLQNNELGELASFFNRESFLGANITIPYKEQIAQYVDVTTDSAREIGAINTIVKENYKLQGCNTDWHGFLAPLKQYRSQLEGQSAVVFGTGGASKAIVVALEQLGMQEIYLVSRTPNRISSFSNFERVRIVSYNTWTSWTDEAALVVNATPLGMHPKTEESPVRDSEKKFLANRICYDIVYNPLETKFLHQAKEVGAPTIGGLEMLIQQGSSSFELWTGKQFPTEKIRSILHERITNEI